jgi:hypothetical protein
MDQFVAPEDTDLVREIIRWSVAPDNELGIFVSVVGEAATRFLQVIRMLIYDPNSGRRSTSTKWSDTLPLAKILFLHFVPESPDNLESVINFSKVFCASDVPLILSDALQERRVEIRLKPGSAAKVHVDNMQDSKHQILQWSKQ